MTEANLGDGISTRLITSGMGGVMASARIPTCRLAAPELRQLEYAQRFRERARNVSVPRAAMWTDHARGDLAAARRP